MCPALTVSMVEMQLSSVVFPEPEAHNADELPFVDLKTHIGKRLCQIASAAVVFLYIADP